MMQLLILFFIFISNDYVIANEKHKIEIINEKTFSGPMGMGLVKSYEIGEKKICLYTKILKLSVALAKMAQIKENLKVI